MMRTLLILTFLALSVFPTYGQTSLSLSTFEIISSENIEALAQVAIIEIGGNIREVVWSPDGTRLAIVRDVQTERAVEVWDFHQDRLPEMPLSTFIPEAVDTIDWLPDSQTLVTHGDIYIEANATFHAEKWDTETGQKIETLLNATVTRTVRAEIDDFILYEPAVSPVLAWNSDYTEQITSSGDLTLENSRGETFSSDYEGGWIQEALWSDSDQWIAVIFRREDFYQIEILDAESLESKLMIYGEDYSVTKMVWSPDNLTLAVLSSWSNPFNPLVNVRIYPNHEPVIYGSGATILSADIPDEVRGYKPALIWSPNSQILGVGFPEAVEFYETQSYSILASLPPFVSLSWHPAGNLIASGSSDGAIRLWGIIE